MRYRIFHKVPIIEVKLDEGNRRVSYTEEHSFVEEAENAHGAWRAAEKRYPKIAQNFTRVECDMESPHDQV